MPMMQRMWWHTTLKPQSNRQICMPSCKQNWAYELYIYLQQCHVGLVVNLFCQLKYLLTQACLPVLSFSGLCLTMISFTVF